MQSQPQRPSPTMLKMEMRETNKEKNTKVEDLPVPKKKFC
jgi:hypothetical protein